MVTRADDLIERRRMRRKLTFWRAAALLIVALAIGFASWRFYAGGSETASVDHIARIKIEGTITEDEELLERLRRARESDRVQGVILWLNTPGGTTAGGEAVYEEVRRLAQAKPTVAQIGTLAASAGYMVASGADQIVARQSSIVGSIGVMFQYPDITGLMDNIGIRVEGVKSSPLKAEPSPFTPTTEEARAMIRRLIMDSYEWFVGIVDERRPLSRQEVLAVADGSIFTGRQALDLKLVDRIGGESEARAWLAEEGVNADLRVVEWKRRSDTPWYFGGAAQALASWIGLPQDIFGIARRAGTDRIFLDGLVSVWQPDLGG